MMRRSLLSILAAGVLASGISAIINRACMPATVLAHAGSPSLPTFSSGQALTAAQLNQAFQHVDAPFSAGITDSMVATNAAIAHTKLATPALVPKAKALVGTESAVCDGGAAVDSVSCTLGESTGVTAVRSSGTNGTYRVTLSYTPVDVDFVPLLTPITDSLMCRANSLSTSAPHFRVTCKTSAAGVGTNAAFVLVVLDT